MTDPDPVPAAVTIHPRRCSGNPTVAGSRVQVWQVAETVWWHGEDGIAEYEDDFGFTREHILTACWFAAVYPVQVWRGALKARRSPYRKRWANWAEQHHKAMWEGRWDDVPCPPCTANNVRRSALALGAVQQRVTGVVGQPDPGPGGGVADEMCLGAGQSVADGHGAGVVERRPSGAGCHGGRLAATESRVEGLTKSDLCGYGKSMSRYEKVSYRIEGQRRPRVVFLENVRILNMWCGKVLVGHEVDESGDTKWFAAGTTEREHVISVDVINRRQVMQMNWDLGLLEIPDPS